MRCSEEELLENLNDLNKDHLKAVSLFKFPSGRTFKIECLSYEKCIDHGLAFDNCSIFGNGGTLSARLLLSMLQH